MPLRIYYLDDEIELLGVFKETFESPDREIITFSNPDEALNSCRSQPPDIFFIDFRLPKYTGDQIAKLARGAFSIVVITGDLEIKSEYKFDAYFEKPFKVDLIEAFLKKHTPKRAAS